MISIREAIYGDLATVFHRTSVKDLIDRVYTNGYKPGNGSMYGRGFYGTYELSSQESSFMSETYGNIVVKFSVPVQDFVIFDEEEFMKTSNYKRMLREKTDKHFLVWQIEDFSGKPIKNEYLQFIEYMYRDLEYSSEVAKRLWKDLQKICNGIIFTGGHDGHVLVCYEPKLIIPLSFREDGKKDFEKVPTNLKYLSDYVDSKFDIEREIDWTDLSDTSLTKLPKGIPSKVVGGFDCSYNSLASLKGSPKEVSGTFRCVGNDLTSLEGSPETVSGDFDCSQNSLTSLKGLPKNIGGDLDCSHNQLVSLEGLPKKIRGDVTLFRNKRKFTKEEVLEVCDVMGKVYV